MNEYELVFTATEGDTTYKVIRFTYNDKTRYSVLIVNCCEIIRHNEFDDCQRAMFEVAQSLICDFAGAESAKVTRKRIRKMFKSDYFVANSMC